MANNASTFVFISGLLLFLNLGCSNTKNVNHISGNQNYPTNNLQRKLKAGENHIYSIRLNAGTILHIKAEQSGIDVIAKVTTARGEFTQQFDSPNGELGAEDIYLLSDEDQKYNIEIYPAQKYADPGDYALTITRSGKATEADKKWMAALAATQKGR